LDRLAPTRRTDPTSLPPPRDSDVLVLAGVSRKRAWALTALATLALSITLVHRQTLAAVAATVTSALDVSDFEYGCLSSGMAAAFMLGSLPAARLMQRVGPRAGLAMTLAMTSLVIGLHSVVAGFAALLLLRISMGFAAAPSLPAATHAIHRVLPFGDRSRGIGLLYWGNSLGSAACPPIAVWLESAFGWRDTFFWVAVAGVAWIPVWLLSSLRGQSRAPLDSLTGVSLTHKELQLPLVPARVRSLSLREIINNPGIVRGSLLVAAAAPVNLIMLIWAAKYLVRDHGLAQLELARYLWAPALSFGLGSLVFGELRARSARTRATARPARKLVALATLLSAVIAAVPYGYDPALSILFASVSMLGAGGLYTLSSSDMLAHAPRQAVPSIASVTTIMQSVIYIVAAPVIGQTVQHFGHYRWVMLGAGLWVLPGSLYWILDATLRRPRTRDAQTRR
jgi:predicted MFS family arabinose efflux permease